MSCRDLSQDGGPDRRVPESTETLTVHVMRVSPRARVFDFDTFSHRVSIVHFFKLLVQNQRVRGRHCLSHMNRNAATVDAALRSIAAYHASTGGGRCVLVLARRILILFIDSSGRFPSYYRGEAIAHIVIDGL